MASALNAARPLNDQTTKEFLLEGTLNGSLAVTIDDIPGAKEILAVYPSNKVALAAAAAVQLAISAAIASDRKSVTLYQWTEAGAAGAADHPFSALVLCSVEPNTP